MSTIGITGGTGLVGIHLSQLLVAEGHNVIIFTRNPKISTNTKIKYAHWDPQKQIIDKEALGELNAVVHLAGEGVADKRWTKERKRAIVNSRVEGTLFLISALKQYAINCNTFLSASAIGYYGADNEHKQAFIEDDKPNNDFLGLTCTKWEESAMTATNTFRTIIIRIGIVLGRERGAFKEFEKPMHFGVMPILGTGKQMVSWIHIKDLTNMILHTLNTTNVSGIYNGVAPLPVSHKTLMQTIAKTIGGVKVPITVPSWALKLLLGEMSTEILKSATVSSDKIEKTGFNFQFADIRSAVSDLLNK